VVLDLASAVFAILTTRRAKQEKRQKGSTDLPIRSLGRGEPKLTALCYPVVVMSSLPVAFSLSHQAAVLQNKRAKQLLATHLFPK
jgi:hypothetical protein